ncbi:MAG: phospho-N-acetylmuramoyl-pentapeptide-transferase [Phycisphaerae bacterium]
MVYLFVDYFLDAIEAGPFGFLRLFRFPSFQATAAGIFAFILSLLLGSSVIGYLRRLKIGDNPDFDQADINKLMASKAGTPTMGGVLIIAAIFLSTFLFADLSNYYVRIALVAVVLLGGIGVADDWLKLTAARRAGGRQGLRTAEKFVFQIGIAGILLWFTWNHGQDVSAAHGLFVPFVQEPLTNLGRIPFILIGVFVIVGASNAVNLTDGLDGLAAGSMAFVGFTFLLLALIIGDRQLAYTLLFEAGHHPSFGQMAVVCGALVGACLGFLWFNCNPARVFMGDTGSLAMGGLIGYVAIVIRQEALLALAGGIFVAEAISVMLQVGYFKYTKKRFGEGRRIFRMAPLHHHFQKAGWTEMQVVVRFWLIGAVLAAASIATIKMR